MVKHANYRELKAPCVAFSSPEGRQLFVQSLAAGTLEAYFPLAEHFVTQGHPSFCGIGSLTMALNSLLVDPKRVWQGVWRWFDESMLDCCAPHDIVKMKGITMSKLQCLARCNGATVQLVLGSAITMEQFRDDVKSVCRAQDHANRKVMIVSYHRPKLNQTGSGHFSPIAGYNEAEDMVLIMDVARFKYPPHWAPLSALYNALQPVDPDSGTSRGYLFVSGGQNILHNCKCTEVDEILVDGEAVDGSVIRDTVSVTVCDSNAANEIRCSNSSNGVELTIAISDAVVSGTSIADANSVLARPTPPEKIYARATHGCKSCNGKCASTSDCGSCESQDTATDGQAATSKSGGCCTSKAGATHN
jgi:hypothetical protein